MSKEKPEVGDVWIHSSLVQIFIVGRTYDDNDNEQLMCIRDGIPDAECFGFATQELYPSTIKKYYKYLGKSKANVEELFDVAED